MDIFLVNTLKLLVEGSKETTSTFLCLKAVYIEYKPIFEPISQKTNLLLFLV